MIKVLATNIISPLGSSTQENYRSIKAGRSALTAHADWRGVPEPFTASLFDDGLVESLSVQGFTFFESIVIKSIKEALSEVDVDVTSPRTGLIISTTKANVDALSSEPCCDGNYLHPGASARKIADHLGFTSQPVVVCNACISGVTAQILADRLITGGVYDKVVVCGADVQSPFVVSGFMSFKSLSPEECRPFDIERLGLNLGEAAATMIFSAVAPSDNDDTSWKLIAGCLNNDSYHLSAPSPSGEGTYRAAMEVLQVVPSEALATVGVHGTATMFNDQMESKAVERAGLSDVPLTALKGYYGHTLGAAGVIETIITMCSLDDGVLLPVRGFSEIGVSGKVNISCESQPASKKSFIKLISGFGGCNGAVAFSRSLEYAVDQSSPEHIRTVSSVRITPSSLIVDGRTMETKSSGKDLLTEIYKTYVGDYPKFHKMDILSKVAFLAAELVLAGMKEKDDESAIVLFNSSSSIVADRRHIATYSGENGFYPSPSVFLYTLPNIAAGEIAIRHGFKGETSLYILDKYNEDTVAAIVASTFEGSSVKSMITGWIDCFSDDEFEANIKLVTK